MTDEPLSTLTRRGFVAGAGALVLGASGFGALAAPARAARRFPTADELGADVATAWLDLALTLVRETAGFSPPVASRAFGYTGLTLYEAIVPGMRGFRSLGGRLPQLAPLPAAGRNEAYDWQVVANASLAAILRGLFPASQAAAIGGLETRFEEQLRPTLPAGIFTRSVERGRAIAAAVFAWSRDDGGHPGYLSNFPTYTPPVGPGLWVRTPRGFLSALQPYWGRNRCIAIASGDACPPGDPTPFSEAPGSQFHSEAVEVYEAASNLTAEQETIARFWSDDAGATPTPPGHSISITTQVLRREGASLAAAAEAYARVGIAVSDAFVACWHQKYAYNLLRPVTYIQRRIDPDWLPPLATPPFPDYPSGHSVQSGAAFHVLSELFGDRYAFVDHTHDARGFAPRAFASFSAAAEEAAISRLYGGIHYRPAIERGLEQGICIGRAVMALPMRRMPPKSSSREER